MAGGKGNAVRVVMAAFIANFLIAIAKFVAWSFTLSSAMLAEAFHSVADTGNQALMLLGLKRADKPADESHPYGYGKETYFWSFVVAVSIFALGATVALYEGTHQLILYFKNGPTTPESQIIGMVVLSVSLLIEGTSFLVAIKEYRRDMGDLSFADSLAESRAAAIITVLFEDAAACAGLLIALIGVILTSMTGNPIFDIVATLVIGVILVIVAVFLSYMTKRLLIGHSASPRVEARIREAIDDVPGVDSIVTLRTLHMGAEVIILNLEIAFADGLVTDDLENLIDTIEARVASAVPAVKHIYIEAESFKKNTPAPTSEAAN